MTRPPDARRSGRYHVRMNVPRLAVTLISGPSAALLAYSTFYARGDLGGVMAYLRERGGVRRLAASGASTEQVEAARAQLRALAERVGDPALAAQMVPVALVIGVVVALFVWWLFGSRAARPEQGDVQERMVLRLAYRKGGRFTLDDLGSASPLSSEQARAVTRRMLDAGRLTREGETFSLVR